MVKTESKKKADTVNKEELLFPDLQTLSPLCLKMLLLWKAEQLFDLNLRISELSAALNKKFGDFPDYEESYRFYSTLSRSTKNNYIGFPVAACAEFKIITMDELNTFVRKRRIDIDTTHLQKCFEFAQEVLRIKIKEPHLLLLLGAACSVVSLLYRTINENLQEDMLKTFIAIEHLLTTKSCEAIGYWTRKLIENKGGQQGGKASKQKPGLVTAIKKFKEKSDTKSMGAFIWFLSKKEYTHKTPYQIEQYDLYIDDGLIYHRDRTKKDKRGTANFKSLSIKSLNRYFYDYSK